jgi:hypothetical protein
MNWADFNCRLRDLRFFTNSLPELHLLPWAWIADKSKEIA